MTDLGWQWIIGIAAAWGALLSTYNAFLSRWDRRPRLLVRIAVAYVGHGDKLLNEEMAMLTATNTGTMPITLICVGVVTESDYLIVPSEPAGDAPMPCELGRNQPCTFLIPSRDINDHLVGHDYSGTVRIAAYFRDATERVYKSRWKRFPVRPPSVLDEENA